MTTKQLDIILKVIELTAILIFGILGVVIALVKL
jgi:hypothetical protein